MIVTHMRQTDVKVKVQTPDGTELQKLQKKYATTYIYIGKDKAGNTQVQLNNRIVPMNRLTEAISAERDKLPMEEQKYHTVSLKADRNTPIGVIADVKESLRNAQTLQVSYSASEHNSK